MSCDGEDGENHEMVKSAKKRGILGDWGDSERKQLTSNLSLKVRAGSCAGN